MNVKKENGKNYLIKQDEEVKVIKYDINEEIEIQDLLNRGNTFYNVKKISKTQYVLLDTGEIRDYQLEKCKNMDGLRRSMKKLKYILKNNFDGAENELFIDLTTAEDVTDIRQIKLMFKKWWAKMKKKYNDLEFVAVYEKHKNRDCWHVHTIIKATMHAKLYIPNKIIEEVWKYGFTKTNRITSLSGVGQINEDYRMIYKDSITEKMGIDKVINYMCKIETKEMIPVFERCYDCSKGIKKPKVLSMSYGETKNQMGQDYKLKDQYTSIIRNAETNAILNKIKIETWKKK